MVVCFLGAALLLLAACTEDEVLAVVTCGDGVCNGDEDSSNCPGDCVDTCGNGKCNPEEDGQTCPADCTADCGNGECGSDENALDCPIDCWGGWYPGPCSGDSTAIMGATPDRDETFEYAMVDGELQVSNLSYEPDGGDETLVIFYFDEQWRLTGLQSDWDHSGVIDSVEEFQYDSTGRLTWRSEQWTDGSVHTETTYTYDATGYLAQIYTTDLVASADDVEVNVEWNGDYSLRLDHYDVHADGSVDWTNERTYDANGNLIHEYDGDWDQEVYFFYDQDNLTDISPVAMLQLPWGSLEQQRARLVEYHRIPNDGIMRQTNIIYDEQGNLLRTEFGWDPESPEPSEPRWFTSYSYDCWI